MFSRTSGVLAPHPLLANCVSRFRLVSSTPCFISIITHQRYLKYLKVTLVYVEMEELEMNAGDARRRQNGFGQTAIFPMPEKGKTSLKSNLAIPEEGKTKVGQILQTRICQNMSKIQI